MLDARLGPGLRAALDPAARRLIRLGVGADALTWTGFAFGLAAAAAVAASWYGIGLALFLCNRLFDGLDGAVARRVGPTDRGGFLDITLDFIVYAAYPLGFALAAPSQNALAAAILLFSFIGTSASFLAFASIAAQRGIVGTRHGPKAIHYLGGLTEGTETILAFVLFALFPGWFPWLAAGFGALCLATAAARILQGVRTFSAMPQPPVAQKKWPSTDADGPS
jgi:phosphatidylglycerophosphate synthase